ncbi:HAD-IA family hydrolase [Kushneria marisflavi]|uniref:HAD family hydrolase n=1 Tax=Kushneria marisflavi TaxID=157779 RepID=A0A240ULC3_9GAMM|nr:HAD-IA family hydrolase [Kushneria marisflavi]ART61819.1 HAD family hydrolase [Kushneria marisflavi]RKD86852.1 phosphoglycolate phosphatase [Kushneria marisflavi]
MRYRLIIFDWDGTLMDSADRIVDCMQRAGMDIGWPALSREAVLDIIGLGLPEAIARLCPGIDAERAEHLRKRYADHFVAAEREGPALPFFEGVQEGIARLRAAPDVRLAVATGKSRRGLDRIFAERDCGHWFADSRTADLTRSKPDPLMLVELLETLDVSLEEAVMIGDSVYDMGMAQALGMDRVAVTWGVHNAKQLGDFSPVQVVNNFHDLMGWLESSVCPQTGVEMDE